MRKWIPVWLSDVQFGSLCQWLLNDARWAAARDNSAIRLQLEWGYLHESIDKRESHVQVSDRTGGGGGAHYHDCLRHYASLPSQLIKYLHPTCTRTQLQPPNTGKLQAQPSCSRYTLCRPVADFDDNSNVNTDDDVNADSELNDDVFSLLVIRCYAHWLTYG